MLAAVLCLAGCGTVSTGPTERESHSVEKDSSEALHAELKMGAGSLKVTGGSAKWMQGDFAYNVAEWKPNIKYATSGGHATLTIDQGKSSTHTGNAMNEWNLRLNNEIATDFHAELGAGEARLELGSLALQGVQVEMGAGELRLDLRGKPARSYDVTVRGGAGEATVYLPQGVGLYAKAAGGLGEINVKGLRKEGDHWVNDAYDKAKVQVHVDVQGGVGQINIIAE